MAQSLTIIGSGSPGTAFRESRNAFRESRNAFRESRNSVPGVPELFRESRNSCATRATVPGVAQQFRDSRNAVPGRLFRESRNWFRESRNGCGSLGTLFRDSRYALRDARNAGLETSMSEKLDKVDRETQAAGQTDRETSTQIRKTHS